MSKKKPRILIIRCGLLGDTVDSTVVVKPLISYYGEDLIINWVTKPNLQDLFKFDARITPLLVRFTKLPLLFNIDKLKIIFNSLFNPYDAVINLEVGDKFNNLARLTKGKIKVGMPYKYIAENIKDEHRVEHQLRILKSYFSDLITKDSYPYLKGSDIDVKKKYNIHNDFIIMCPTNSKYGRENHRGYRAWPIKNWRILIDKVLKNTDLDIIITGSLNEQNFIEQLDLYNQRIHNLTGRTNLPNLINLMKYCECAIANDSGSVHVAGVCAKKVIALHGPTPFKETGPYGNGKNEVIEANINLHCSPCYGTDVIKMCNSNKCMINLSPDKVLNYIIHGEKISVKNNVVKLINKQ
tara:strand:+ start:7867 stop:8925 length:1059 start_codon:yes stop_codon:yes gene_type:complete